MTFKIRIRPTDALFSKIIKERDNYTCQVPHCQKRYPRGSRGIHNSHFWGRGHEASRFSMENCISLCFYHHNLWGHGDERPQYEAFMKKRLGEDGFKRLDILAHSYQKRDDKIMLLYLEKLSKEYGLL